MTFTPATPPAGSPPVSSAPKRLWIGWAIALTASTLFSIATPVSRGALTAGVGASEILVTRLTVATLLMGLTIAIMDVRLLRPDKRCFWIATAAGLLNGIGMLFFFWGLERLTASMIAMMIALNPIFVLSILALRGERVTYRHAIRITIALIGIYLLIGVRSEVAIDFIGIMWVMLAMVCFAVQLSLIQWFLLDYDARQVTLYVLLAMCVCVVGMWGLEGGVWQPLGQQGWITALVLAIPSTYVARLLLFAAISRIGGGQMAMLTPVETLLSIFWAFLFLDERLTPLQWVGGIFILTSAVLAIQRLSIARLRPRWRLWAKS